MQIKTTRCHLTPIRMTTIKKKEESLGKVVEKLKLLCTVDRNVKWYSCCIKQYGSSSKIKNRNCKVQQFHFWIYTQKN